MTVLGWLLVLLHGLLVPVTAYQEARLNRVLERSVRHEGRYLAEILGEPWPGPAR